MWKIKGVAASPGIAIGPVFFFRKSAIALNRRHVIDTAAEINRLHQALATAKQDLAAIAHSAVEKVGQDQARIFEAQLLFLEDPELLGTVKQTITAEQVNVEYAWNTAITHYTQLLSQMENEVFSARSADIQDVGHRVLAILTGQSKNILHPPQPSIILAEDLSPTDTINLERGKALAFATVSGGPTSHVAILSKALGIPCVLGLGIELHHIPDNTTVIVDGSAGEVIIEPAQDILAEIQTKINALRDREKQASASAFQPAITRDGKRMEVAANIGSLEDAAKAAQLGADGVGLFRTEFLFLNRENPPSETEQIALYRSIFQMMGNLPIVVRTLDIGGDKPAPYLSLPPESNPFLGLRGLRLCLQNQVLFESQLRALLQAGAGFDLRIMFPMVSSVEEIQSALARLEKVKNALQKEKASIAEQLQVGIMVEVPSIALLAGKAAPWVDFFSIGTNDLAQYTLAADRTNPSVAGLADAFHPAVLKLIHNVILSAHRHHRWVGLCGEFAGDLLATPLLLGLGLDELSVSPQLVPLVKESIRRFSLQESQAITKRALKMEDARQVREYLTKFRL
ncbi:MAG: phosphoenolpyruvate--protein phosphotransferase [Chloroflexota bacterium]